MPSSLINTITHMPYTITQYQATPNPNALKCILDRPLPEPVRSFRSAAEAQAASDPLAQALFAIPGVTNLLLSGEWLTINKAPEASWPSIKKAAEKTLAGT